MAKERSYRKNAAIPKTAAGELEEHVLQAGGAL